jgi:hypothetical protein
MLPVEEVLNLRPLRLKLRTLIERRLRSSRKASFHLMKRLLLKRNQPQGRLLMISL